MKTDGPGMAVADIIDQPLSGCTQVGLIGYVYIRTAARIDQRDYRLLAAQLPDRCQKICCQISDAVRGVPEWPSRLCE